MYGPETIKRLIGQIAHEVGVALPSVRVTAAEPVLPSAFRIDLAAAASVGAMTAAVAAYAGAGEAGVDSRHAEIAFQSERHFLIGGTGIDPWAPLSGDYRTSDGWVRLHCNFAHHRDAALRALGLSPAAEAPQREDVAEACSRRTACEIEEAVTREGGCAAAMRSRQEWLTHPQAAAVAGSPLVGLRRIDAGRAGGRTGEIRGSGPRPLSGVRVLDLTRVIAGPVAGRALAAYGADVLRVGAAGLPEVPGLVVETAFGKRSCHVDLRAESEVLRELVRHADVVIQAYRPGTLRDRGFGPEDLARLRPGIVCVDISAYGSRGPWAARRGFDSLVQMATGLAHENGDGSRPHPLPAQVLDHASGYLAAFAATAGLLRRRAEGGSWHAEVSLAGTAQWLCALGPGDREQRAQAPMDDLQATMDSSFGTLTYVRPPGWIQGAEPYWASPPPRQGEHPAEWVTTTTRG
ncbi:CoA transferase [Planotetraspora thailandica]|uniref:CoA transferase n=1 Tax=Planotetraspora thailandica TaxID=487172 RepID=A0A8J3Y175_9ACTN|nr:CoA transferase [Planotetraspora thailandica]GII58987.1 CoA transferase [Planotetraspora thailandica]